MFYFFTTHKKFLFHNGGDVYTRNLISFLKAEFEIDVGYFQHEQSSNLICKIKKLWSVVSSLFSYYPAKVCYFKRKISKNEVEKILLSKALFIDHLDLYWFAIEAKKINPELKVFLVNHNFESKLYKSGLSRVLRFFLYFDIKKYLDFEANALATSDFVIALSKQDQNIFTKYNKNVFLQLPLFDYERSKAPISKSKYIRIGCIVNMNWWPNAEGVNWFLNNVIPIINNQYKSKVEFNFYGPKTDKLDVTSGVVNGHGFVESLSEVWLNNDIMINPVFNGSGINIKMCEYLYNNKPVLSSSFVKNAFPEEALSSVVFADSADEWASAICNFVDGIIPEVSEDTHCLFSRLSFIEELKFES